MIGEFVDQSKVRVGGSISELKVYAFVGRTKVGMFFNFHYWFLRISNLEKEKTILENKLQIVQAKLMQTVTKLEDITLGVSNLSTEKEIRKSSSKKILNAVEKRKVCYFF